MKNTLLLTIVIIAGLLVIPGYSGSAGGPAEWMRTGVGARAKGLGQAFVAVANDASAAYYNPAGLAQLRDREFTFMLSNLSLDRKLNYLGYTHPLRGKAQSISVSWLGFGVGNIDERDEHGSSQGTFDFDNNALQLSYSRELLANLYGGVSVKYIESKYDGLSYTSNGSGDGYGLDFGLLYRIRERYTLGVAVQDAASALDWKTGASENIPRVMRLGAAGSFFDGKLMLTGEADNESFSNETTLNIGAEYWMLRRFAVRAGSHDSHFTGGLSYQHPYDSLMIKLDYAYVQDTFSQEFSQSETHLFSLGLTF